MSYILDALRRADAERQRGAVPSLHDQPAPRPEATAVGRGTPWAWVLVGSAVVLGIAVAAWWMGRGGAIAPMPSVPAQRAELAPPAPVAPAVAAVQAAPTAAPQPAGPTTVTVTVTGPGVTSATPSIQAPEPRSSARKGAPAASAPATAIAAAAAAASPASATAEAVPATARVPTLAELPDTIRQQVPPLTLGGGVYSTQASQRLVIVNGQVVHEGDQPAAGLRVVQIRPRSVVFSFRGQAFEIGL